MGIRKQNFILEQIDKDITNQIEKVGSFLDQALKEASGGTPIDVLGAIPSEDKSKLNYYFEYLQRLLPSSLSIARRGMDIVITPTKYSQGPESYNTQHDNTPNQPILPESTQEFQYTPYLESIINHMKDQGMNIEPLPEIETIIDYDNAEDVLGKTAYYDPNAKKVALYITGRHPKDVLRSFCHEMIHHMQNIEGRLGNIQTTNTQEDDHLAKIEQEAHYLGSITLRHWEDNIKKQQMDSAEKAPLDENIINELEEKEIYFWAMHAHLFSILNKHPEKYIELRRTMEGTELEALDYFWGLIGQENLKEQTVMEGRYDSLSSTLAGMTLNIIKKAHQRASIDQTGEYLTGKVYYKQGEEVPAILSNEQPHILFLEIPESLPKTLQRPVEEEFYFIVKVQFVEGLGDYRYGGHAYTSDNPDDTPIVEVTFEIDPKDIPQVFSEVYEDALDIIRHEIEHMTQRGTNLKPGKFLASDTSLRTKIEKGDLPAKKYFMLDKEIPAMIQGLYFRAKKTRTPFRDVVDAYLDRFLEMEDGLTGKPYISSEDKQEILNTWRDYLPKLGIKKEYWF